MSCSGVQSSVCATSARRLQLRPTALKRLFHRDEKLRSAQRWYYRIGRRVWFFEWANWLFRERRTQNGPTVEAMWGKGQVAEEFPNVLTKRVKKLAEAVTTAA